jgi:hypothetical protein
LKKKESTKVQVGYKNVIFTKKEGQFEGSGKRILINSQKSATRTSIDKSLSIASVEDVFPRILSRGVLKK